ncbi:MAG TPA: MFS transporter [Pyrinomonadaceae bacterium]|jgi:EmrB/QacA subfamily drug resistance transporter
MMKKDNIITERPPYSSTVRGALAGLSLSMLLSSLGTSVANVALPTLSQEFRASFQEVQWVVLAYLLAVTTLIVSAGRFADIIGRRQVLLAGIFLFTIASILCGFAPSLWLLITFRVIQGLGAAIMMTLSIAFIGETVPKEKTGSAMGLLGTMSAIGTALGPSLGGILISGIGWQAIFLVNVPLGLLTLIFAYRYLPAERQRSKYGSISFDSIGTLLLVLTLTAYALAMSSGRGNFGALNAILLLAAFLGVGIFVFNEAKSTSPLIQLGIFRESQLSVGLAASALVSTVLMATLVVGPFYLSRSLGLDTALVGIIMSIGPMVVAAAGVPVGRAVDRFGAESLVILGLTCIMTGSLMLSVIPSEFGIVGYIIPTVVITAGYAMFQTANNTVVMKDVPATQRGTISGMLNLSRNLGLITGTSVMGAIFAFASGTNDMTSAQPGAVAAGMHVSFGVSAILIVVALSFVLGNRFFQPCLERA